MIPQCHQRIRCIRQRSCNLATTVKTPWEAGGQKIHSRCSPPWADLMKNLLGAEITPPDSALVDGGNPHANSQCQECTSQKARTCCTSHCKRWKASSSTATLHVPPWWLTSATVVALSDWLLSTIITWEATCRSRAAQETSHSSPLLSQQCQDWRQHLRDHPVRQREGPQIDGVHSQLQTR